jgi:hypothetical protein
MFDREKFLKPDSAKLKQVQLDGHDDVWIRKLTQAEVEYTKRNYGTDDKALAGFRYVVCKCLVNENGSRVFEDKDQERMQGVDFDSMQTLANEILEFSGLNKNAKKA